MIDIVTIKGTLDGLNEFLDATKKHRLKGAEMKAANTEVVRLSSLRCHKFKTPVHFTIRYHEPTNKRDPDNVAFAKKFIFDGLVSAGVIPNDTRKWVIGWDELVLTDKKNPRIEILIRDEV